MSYDWMWFDTSLPKDVVELVARDARQFENDANSSVIFSHNQTETDERVDTKIRSSQTAWIPESHWIAGFVMHYAHIANNDNYQYDLTGIDGHKLQYGIYGTGGHYTWHSDYGISNCHKFNSDHRHGIHEERVNSQTYYRSELVRKLSFSLQLTDTSEYEGGDLELVSQDGKVDKMERAFGRIIFFDSRVIHRVTPVTKGERRSIVGWIVGPRWK